MLVVSGQVAAQVADLPGVAPVARELTPAEALAQDAAWYARLHAVPADEALRRVAAEEESVSATDALARRHRDRLAGVAWEHEPQFRLVVRLTGDAPVPDEAIEAGGLTIPVHFRTGARATREQLLAALAAHQADIRASLSRPPGIGVDPRDGALVVMAPASDVRAWGADELARGFEAMTGVPVRVEVPDRAPDPVSADMAVEGGARVTGTSPDDGRRYLCTTGYAVTDGARDGVATAAHCLDQLSYAAPDQPPVPLRFVGQWGWGFQDVQLHLSPVPLAPLFFSDTAKTLVRPVTGQRGRLSTRAGDLVCHRGERTGYSCAEVRFTDFAPAGDLCGGPCLPSWVAVSGPTCGGGDSGAPVFLGATALGLVKGGTYRADGGCSLYFYMSVDYLPPGWSLLKAPAIPIPATPNLANIASSAAAP